LSHDTILPYSITCPTRRSSDLKGEYELAGTAVHKLPHKKRQALARDHVGFIFQHYHLLDDMTVYENLELPLTYRNMKTAERQARSEEHTSELQSREKLVCRLLL